jgi:hypothetical protein
MFRPQAAELEDRQQERGLMIHRDDIRIFRKQARGLATAIAIAVVLLGAQATSFAAGGKELAAAPAARTDRPTTAPDEAATAVRSPSMDQRYAARETKSKQMEDFKGGDVVIIGSGGLVLVLLIVLLIVII